MAKQFLWQRIKVLNIFFWKEYSKKGIVHIMLREQIEMGSAICNFFGLEEINSWRNLQGFQETCLWLTCIHRYPQDFSDHLKLQPWTPKTSTQCDF